MKICHLIPGSGGTFYCQNCLRDYALVRALRKRGEDAMMIPLYLPPHNESTDSSQETPIFFGGIGVYLREHIPFLRNAPEWIDRLLDHPRMLRYAASREGSTNAATLGPMTLSMLKGCNGPHHKEYRRLVEWLAQQEKPDLIHISNALLLGLAPEIKRTLNVPIICSLQDEEPWVEAMHAPYNRLCWEAIAQCAASVDTFVSTSAWYADRMSARIGIPRSDIRVIHLGVEIDDASAPVEPSFSPPTIGFLSRINPAQGFDLLIDAFITLKQEPALRDLRLRATGGCTQADRPFVDAIRSRLRTLGMEDALDIVPEFNKSQRDAFLRTISVLSVPVPGGEAFGIQLIEAMAQGVPVVQPRDGAYVEIVETTGGGILYDPAEPGALIKSLRALLCDPARAVALGKCGHASVMERFTMDRVAQDMANLYKTTIEARR